MTSFFSIQQTINKDLIKRNMDQEYREKFLVTAIYFAQLAYFNYAYIHKHLTQVGAESISVYDRHGVQAIFAEFDTFAVISFKGREIDRWQDLKTDLRFWKTYLNKFKVHSGFARSLSHVSKRLEIDLSELAPHKKILYTGHSLGGALAMLMALQHRPTDVCTFGSPRVFNIEDTDRYFNGVNITRVHAENDLVPNLPPIFTGYKHIGNSISIAGKDTKWDSHKLVTYLRGIVKYDKDLS